MNDKEIGSQAAYGHAALLMVLGLAKYMGQNGYLPDAELRNIVDQALLQSERSQGQSIFPEMVSTTRMILETVLEAIPSRDTSEPG